MTPISLVYSSRNFISFLLRGLLPFPLLPVHSQQLPSDAITQSMFNPTHGFELSFCSNSLHCVCGAFIFDLHPCLQVQRRLYLEWLFRWIRLVRNFEFCMSYPPPPPRLPFKWRLNILSLALSWFLWCCLCCIHVIFNHLKDVHRLFDFIFDHTLLTVLLLDSRNSFV